MAWRVREKGGAGDTRDGRTTCWPCDGEGDARSANLPKGAEHARVGLALDLALGERAPETQRLVAGARDDRLPVGRGGEVEDLRASERASEAAASSAACDRVGRNPKRHARGRYGQ